ncbi:MAG: hypothetical protein NC388_00140 [Clostridium sp.]|nr:hypothetical protein [Clostridium sp.]
MNGNEFTADWIASQPTNPYGDIIHLSHYEPKFHPRMSVEARAAQFAPFAALAGHDEAVHRAATAFQHAFDRMKDGEWSELPAESDE